MHVDRTADELAAAGKKPYIVPGVASNVIGAIGYAVSAEENMAQLNEMRLVIDHIIVPSGSAGTHVGMAVGMAGVNGGISISGSMFPGRKTYRKRSSTTWR